MELTDRSRRCTTASVRRPQKQVVCAAAAGSSLPIRWAALWSARETMGHSVAIVVDRHFGDRPLDLAERVHVWICASPENRRLAESYWQAAPRASLERGITTFRVADSDAADEMLIGVLDTVDLHHGDDSHTPPWDTLEVYGASATSAVRHALAEFGVAESVETDAGFRCSRLVKGGS